MEQLSGTHKIGTFFKGWPKVKIKTKRLDCTLERSAKRESSLYVLNKHMNELQIQLALEITTREILAGNSRIHRDLAHFYDRTMTRA